MIFVRIEGLSLVPVFVMRKVGNELCTVVCGYGRTRETVDVGPGSISQFGW